MERALLKMAQQLNQYDENSLMDLWADYANKVADFEPSARWEEYALAFCMIQAVHWKNQLFNAELAESARRGKKGDDKALRNELASFSKGMEGRKKSGPDPSEAAKTDDAKKSAGGKKGCKVLVFRPGEPSQP